MSCASEADRPFAIGDIGPVEREIYARIEGEALEELRQIWADAKRAQLEAQTAMQAAEMVMRRCEEFAGMCKAGRLPLPKSCMIFGPMDDDTIEALANGGSEEALEWQT